MDFSKLSQTVKTGGQLSREENICHFTSTVSDDRVVVCVHHDIIKVYLSYDMSMGCHINYSAG